MPPPIQQSGNGSWTWSSICSVTLKAIISVDAEDKPKLLEIIWFALDRETMGDPIIYSYYDFYLEDCIPELSRSQQLKEMTGSPTPSKWDVFT